MAEAYLAPGIKSRKEALKEEVRRIEELLDRALALTEEDEDVSSDPADGSKCVSLD